MTLHRLGDHAAAIVAALALIVGPVAAYIVDDQAEGAVAELDATGTDAALGELDEAALERGHLAARIDALDALVAALAAQVEELSRRPATTVRSASAPRLFDGSDRWDALAACESTGDADGVEPHRIELDPDGFHLTAYQFSPDTARKVGAYRGMPYEDAKAAAQRWAGMVDARSSAGWPTCWPLVMGDTPA